MAYNLKITRVANPPLELSLDTGDTLFVLGANGCGKSSLMLDLYSKNQGRCRRITAHRQTWFASNAVTLSAADKRNTEGQIQAYDARDDARWTDVLSAQRASVAIYNLIDAENVRARGIAAAVDANQIQHAQDLAKSEAPLKQINELLKLSNIPVELTVQANEQVLASKAGGPPYSVAELSDGERNALLIAAEVLTAKDGTLILIDEPERHLHRSIISPLLTLIFARRPDCSFVVSTHEVMLPVDNPRARTLLLRGCAYANSKVTGWDADLLPEQAPIDDALRRDILGSRRRIVFVEGTEQSLDKPLYALVFPEVSVVPKSSCRDVEHAVSGIRASQPLHWIEAFGIVDNDRRPQADCDRLKERHVHALSVSSVESIYYHPEIQRRVAVRHSNVTGDDAARLLAEAKSAATKVIAPHVQRLSERIAEKAIREQWLALLPSRTQIVSGDPVTGSVDVAKFVAEEKARLSEAVAAEALTDVIARYPVRETSALEVIAKKLGFQDRVQYEGCVRKLLADDKEALTFVRGLFGTLVQEIGVVPTA
jgi:ABC-type lipoprotein export system ATPase subunit